MSRPRLADFSGALTPRAKLHASPATSKLAHATRRTARRRRISNISRIGGIVCPANPAQTSLRIGVDVGGTFTDLVATDGRNLHVVKIPSTSPDFHRAVIETIARAGRFGAPADIIHGSTVATNALLQRKGEPVAFITTRGFRDMLLIGRQNRPALYALNIVRPQPLTADENWFTVSERISATGDVVEALDDAEVDRLIAQIQARGLRHVAVCLLFSFINPAHEQMIGRKCAAAGLSVSLSSEVLPEFREYERASTTVINAALRPVVKEYLDSLSAGLSAESSLRILHSSGGTFTVSEASQNAARLVLSGPAGGVMGAAFVAQQAGFSDVITYDMGGTSTDVAVILDGRPQWTTSTTIDGIPIGLPMFDIHTVGAGGGSVAFLDAGGALRVGPRSAGAIPGPACYARGGTEPTVTDANLLLGRILPNHFLGGAMSVETELARNAIARLAHSIGKSDVETALGIVRIAEANMERAIRQVTSRRGHDPGKFALVSFGGAGGLHACVLAEALDIPRVIVPPMAGVLSALGMIVAPPVADASRTVVHLGDALDNDRMAAELGSLSGQTIDKIAYEQTDRVEAYADVRFRGQSHEVKVKLDRPSLEQAAERFTQAYRALNGAIPEGRTIEVVTLHVRRFGKSPELKLPSLDPAGPSIDLMSPWIDATGVSRPARAIDRRTLLNAGEMRGPFLLIDPEATTLIPEGWTARITGNGIVLASRGGGEGGLFAFEN